jgi:hypothetical protein
MKQHKTIQSSTNRVPQVAGTPETCASSLSLSPLSSSDSVLRP